MKKYIYSILLTLIVPFIVFSLKFNNGYCASYALDSASQSALSAGAFADLFDCGIGFDPISISINLSTAYDRINSYLYNRYGWDIEDKLYEGVDTAQLPNYGLDSLAYQLSGGTIQTFQQASTLGYMLFKDNVLGNYVLGKLNQASDTITDVFNNTFVKFDENLLSKFSSVKEDLLLNNELYNMSVANGFLYTDNAKFLYTNTSNGRTVQVNIDFGRDVVLTSNTVHPKDVYIISDYNLSIPLSVSGQRVISTGSVTSIDSVGVETLGSFVYDGITYYFGHLMAYDNGSGFGVQSDAYLGDITDVIGLVEDGVLDGAICFDTTSNSYSALLSLLDLLKGHFVSTSQLDSIYALLGQYTAEGVLDGGNSVPAIDYSQDILSALEGVIEGILSDNEAIDDSLSVTPEPPTPDYSNTGISVPSDFPTPILSTLFDSVSLPFNFFSIFQPIFDIFGSSSGLFSLWTFIPSIILIAFIIWALH